MKILAINLGKSQSIKIGNKAIDTGIYKESTVGQVAITSQGLAGDWIADRDRHGGADQAVYLYSAADYEWWEKALGQKIAYGTFGENLTLAHFGQQPLRIGDRFTINGVVLEITFGRVPCATLGARMNDPQFVKKFVDAGRCGVYTRVLQTGTVQQGDIVSLLPAVQKFPTVQALYDLFHAKERDPDLLRRGLEAPIASRARRAFQHWFDQSRQQD